MVKIVEQSILYYIIQIKICTECGSYSELIMYAEKR